MGEKEPKIKMVTDIPKTKKCIYTVTIETPYTKELDGQGFEIDQINNSDKPVIECEVVLEDNDINQDSLKKVADQCREFNDRQEYYIVNSSKTTGRTKFMYISSIDRRDQLEKS